MITEYDLEKQKRKERLFAKYLLSRDIEWGEHSGIEKEILLELFQHLFNNAYSDVLNKRMGDGGKYYEDCRLLIIDNLRGVYE